MLVVDMKKKGRGCGVVIVGLIKLQVVGKDERGVQARRRIESSHERALVNGTSLFKQPRTVFHVNCIPFAGE